MVIGYAIWYQDNFTQCLNVDDYIIPTYKSTYDSFLMVSRNNTYIAFYNFADTGKCFQWRPSYSSYRSFGFEYGYPTNCVIYKLNSTGTEITDTYTSFNNLDFQMDWTNAYKCYSNRNVYDGYNNTTTIWLESTNESIQNATPNFVFDIALSTINNTTQPIYCYTAWNDISLAQTYECYISTNSTNWDLMHYETLTDNGTTTFRFRYPILANGTYYFKVYNKDTEESSYYSLQVTNILSTSQNSGFTSSGIPQPFLNYKKVNDDFIIYTQYFSYNDITRYQCYFTNDTTNTTYSTWTLAPISSVYNDTYNLNYYYFSTTIPTDSSNLTLSFVFYDTILEEYGYPSSITCDTSGMIDYSKQFFDYVNGVDTSSGNVFSGFILTQDPGIEVLFTKLYNAFCTDEVLDVDLTIPFLNTEFTISSASISSFYPQTLTAIVSVFVWGMIGLYIIKDVRNMINKISVGNVENVSSDVKKEVL